MPANPFPSAVSPLLRSRAEARLRLLQKNQRGVGTTRSADPDLARSHHELQVHQIELEMQNEELRQTGERLEALLEKYTDLYDFAPVGYFSLDERGIILEANLTGATLLGVERSLLINRPMPLFVASSSRAEFTAFLGRIFARSGKHVCEASLVKKDGIVFWADLQAVSDTARSAPRRCCRLALSDVTTIKRAETAQRRMEALTLSNRLLKQEISKRHGVEAALKKSQQHQSLMLEDSQHMQVELRHLSHQILSTQEDERKKISRDLHDVIIQTLTGITVQLARLKTDTAMDEKMLKKNISRTQHLVEESVNVVHQFARDLRPAVLDDLGLIPALHSYMKEFIEQTGIHVSLTAFAGVAKLNIAKRTVLFRVVQEAFANISRHSQASRAEVRIQKLNGDVCLHVKDNGKGFDPKALLKSKNHERLGLLGMRERVEMVSGKLSIQSVPGKGTLVLARIPFENRLPNTARRHGRNG